MSTRPGRLASRPGNALNLTPESVNEFLSEFIDDLRIEIQKCLHGGFHGEANATVKIIDGKILTATVGSERSRKPLPKG